MTNLISWRFCIDCLKSGLACPRKPTTAWRDFEPSLAYGRHHGPSSSTARLAAVTILVYPVDDAPYLALTRRHEQLRSHAGQISFPGGSIDAGETPAAAALRELEEELGVPSSNLKVAGELSPIFIFNSNFVVTPVVVLADHLPTFTIQDAEVAQLLQTPLATKRCGTSAFPTAQSSRSKRSASARSVSNSVPVLSQIKSTRRRSDTCRCATTASVSSTNKLAASFSITMCLLVAWATCK